jgi:hypothetical protein
MSIYLQFDFHDNWEINLRKQFSKNNFKKSIKSFTPSFETKVLRALETKVLTDFEIKD